MKVCVFCSSANAINKMYKSYAVDFGKWLADNDMSLVYGGAIGGLMDCVAKGVSSKRASIIGVVPQTIIDKGRLSLYPTQIFKVDSMNNRKSMMKQLSDVFVVFPGGFGTLDEWFDVYASLIVGEHNKPILVFNPDNYWQGIKMQFDRFEEEGTGARKSVKKSLKFFEDLDDLKNELISINNK